MAGETCPEYALRNPFVFHGQTLTTKPASSCAGHAHADPPVRQPRSSRRSDPHRPQPAAPRPGGGEAVLIGRAGGPGGAAVRPHGGDGRADGAVPAGCAAPPARGGPAGERGAGPAGGAGGESRGCGDGSGAGRGGA